MENHYNSVMSASKMDKSNANCLVCFDKFPDSVFFECGHGGNYKKLFFFLTIKLNQQKI
jgi:hypothetical protein